MRGVHAPRIVALSAACAVAGVCGTSPSAEAVIVVGGAPLAIDNGHVGSWNGGSAVAVGEHWIISARHMGGAPGSTFTLQGQQYTADRIVHHPTLDILLARVTEPLPGWHRISPNPRAGDEVILGGVGYQAGQPLAGGYAWGAPGLAFGRNTIDAVGQRIMITFAAPGSPGFVDGQATFALLDSGGGLFTRGPGDELHLAGIAVSISGAFGTSLFGSRAFAVNLEPISAWIVSHVSPGEPIASSIAATPGGSIASGPATPAPGAALTLLCAGMLLAGRRRR